MRVASANRVPIVSYTHGLKTSPICVLITAKFVAESSFMQFRQSTIPSYLLYMAVCITEEYVRLRFNAAIAAQVQDPVKQRGRTGPFPFDCSRLRTASDASWTMRCELMPRKGEPSVMTEATHSGFSSVTAR